jgi:hypothetical protein
MRRPPVEDNPKHPTKRHKTIAEYVQTSVMKLAASGAHSGPSTVVSTAATATRRMVIRRSRRYVAQMPTAPTNVVWS